MTVKEIMEYAGCEDAKIFCEPSFESAFIGISHDDRAVYDYEKMIEWAVTKYGWTIDEARDFIDCDTISSCMQTHGAPIIVFRYDV